MRDRATRVVPSAMPNSSPDRTSSRLDRRGRGHAEQRRGHDRPRRERSSVGHRRAARCLTRLCHVLMKCNIEGVRGTTTGRTITRSPAPSSPTPPGDWNAMATELHPTADPATDRPSDASATTIELLDVDALEPLPGQGGMIPPASALPLVLPTDRLNARGMALPPIREDLRRIHERPQRRQRRVGLDPVVRAASPWCAGSRRSCPSPLALPVWAATFLLMGRAFALLRDPRPRGGAPAAVLQEADQRLRRPLGASAYPAFVPLDVYRRSHFAHHKDEFGPNEPDLNLYNGYPITARLDAAQAHARRGRQHRVEEPQGPAAARCAARAARPVALKILVARSWCSPCCSPSAAGAAGGSTRCSGWRRG